ncbi:MAG: hypothetical protein OSB01_00365 [Nitrosomonadaceae bacterium]|nr:hypothetical protein [Nitrosomonadaceae bacterium]
MKKFTLAIFGLFVLYSTGYTQESLELSVDCANVQIDYSDDPTLTRGERIHKMDKSLSKSLDNFKLCNQETKKIETNVANDNSGGAGEATGNSKAENMGEAIASSTISGTELPAAKDDAQEESEDSLALQTINNKNGNYQGSVSTANGKHPDDIPSANNDSALAAQIRRAAVNETDPIKKKLLWDEYRKYKGLTE